MKNIKNISQDYLNKVKESLDALDLGKVQKIAEVLFEAYKNDKQIFIIGNGGSASNASHFAGDLRKGTLKNIYDENEGRFRAISLTDNTTIITALGNDLSYENIFSQQLNNLLNKDDVVIGISGSGNSANVINAIQYAKKCGAKTVGLLGFKTGGKLHELVDYEITVQENHYGRIEDVHLLLAHLITSILFELKNNKLEHGEI